MGVGVAPRASFALEYWAEAMLNAICRLEDATEDIDSSGPCVGRETTLPAAFVNDAYC